MESVCIVGCTAQKRSSRLPAEELYSSELFRRSRRYAQANFDRWLILSAKHGLVEPCDEVAPYDQNLASLTKKQRHELSLRVRDQFNSYRGHSKRNFVSICGKEYDLLLRDADVVFDSHPDLSLPIGKKLQALGRQTDPLKTEQTLDAMYEVVSRLVEIQGRMRIADVLKLPLPESGIYLFFDENERRLRDRNQLRIVRVGTHGVSAGSKASLRNRLRTHFGTSAGEGNHRSSIFRLHVGSSLMRRGVSTNSASWGRDAPTTGPESKKEAALERDVSAYLGNLLVAFINVPGNSEKSNDRAYLEQSLIAIISNSHKPLDPPSCRWLGSFSDKRDIRKSGLWNINHTLQRYHPKFVEVLAHYATLPLGASAEPRKQLAPPDWLSVARDDARQICLL